MAEFFFVSRDPNIMGGKACIRDTQITISAVVALLTSGHQKDEVIQMLPVLTREDLTEALAFVARSVDNPGSLKTELRTESKTESSAPSPREETGSAHLPSATSSSVPPKTGPGPLSGSVSPAPTRKMTPVKPAELPGATETAAVPMSKDLQRMAPPAREADSIGAPEGPKATLAPAAPEPEESIELFHPAYPDKPTVTVSPEGLFDRRWCTDVIAWPDIESIERSSGRKNINVTLRHPERYIAAMPLAKRLSARLKMALNIPAFYLDTSSLAIRTKDLYFMATRLWHAHRGAINFRHKRRVRIGKSSRDTAWEKCLPR